MLFKNKVEITVSNRTIIRIIALIVIAMLAIRFIHATSHALELLFLSFFLALALNPAVSWFSHKLKIKSRSLATGLAYIVVIVILGAFITAVAPPIAKQTDTFIRQVPSTLNSLENDSTPMGRFVLRYNLQNNIDGVSQSIHNYTKNIQKPVITTATKVGSALISILTVLVLTFMMLVEGPAWLDEYWLMHPKSRRSHDKQLAKRMYRIVTGYVNGQVLLSALAALITLIALLVSSSLLHVTINAAALAGIVFITGLIPMIGHIIGGIIVVIACAVVSLPLAIIMGIFIVLHQQIENVTLQPYIQARYNELTPLLVFAAAILGIAYGGLLGAFIAIPAAGCAKILIVDFIETRGIKQDD